MIRVLIVTPVRLMSDLIQTLCSAEPDFQVVGSVSTEQQVHQLTREYEVMVVSAALPDGGALNLVRAANHLPNSPAVVVVGLPDVESVLVRYLEAGAAGCVCAQDSSQELMRVIRMAAGRQVALTHDLFHAVLKRVATLAEQYRSASADPAGFERNLTHRERQILHLIAQGYGNREIARSLTIELGTTKNHVHNILDKLKLKNRQDAALYYSLGLV